MTAVLTICHGCRKIAATTRGYCNDCQTGHNRQRNAAPTRQAHHTAAHRTITRIVKARDPNRCATCGSTNDLTIDYITPLARGGRQHSSNARILCRSCNSRKGARMATDA